MVSTSLRIKSRCRDVKRLEPWSTVGMIAEGHDDGADGVPSSLITAQLPCGEGMDGANTHYELTRTVEYHRVRDAARGPRRIHLGSWERSPLPSPMGMAPSPVHPHVPGLIKLIT